MKASPNLSLDHDRGNSQVFTTAIAILRVVQKSDATNEIVAEPTVVDDESKAAAEQLRRRRPNMNFYEMNIPDGSVLHYADGATQVTVVGPKKVQLGNDHLSLTAATRQISGTDYDQPPALYWNYGGRLLRDIYNETYESTE